MKTLPMIFFLLLAVACSSNEKSPSIKTVDVVASYPEMKNLSEIATDIQYIPLETRPEALMKFVNYLKVTDSKFYINTVMELLCFDKSGKFLYKLDKQGRGPEEYTYLSDYDINPEKRQVVVLTIGKLFFYNETDSGFKYTKHFNLNSRPQNCDLIPGQDNILLSFPASTGENKFQCVVINQQGDTLSKKLNYYAFKRISKVQMGFNIDNVINRNDETLRIKGFLTDTMFTISKDYKFTPYMILNTAGKGITTDFLANVPPPDMNSGSPAAAFLMLSEILETERFLLFRYYFEKQGYWVVYDKNSGTSTRFDTKTLLKDDISGGLNIDPKFCYNGKLYSWTDALTFKKYMSENASIQDGLKNPARAAELRKMAESIKEEDNHILIAITPKK